MHLRQFDFSGAQASTESGVQLEQSEEVDLDSIQTAQDCITSASNPEIVSQLERLVLVWCKQIEQVSVIQLSLQSSPFMIH